MSSLSSDAERGGGAGVGRSHGLVMAALTLLAKGASTHGNMKPRQRTRPLAAAEFMSELRNDPTFARQEKERAARRGTPMQR
jgi:hypothetical protein